jgi:hypothetical protein
VDIHFTVGTSCERAAPLAEKNAAALHHVLRSLISLHNEHRVDAALLSANFREIIKTDMKYLVGNINL